MSVVRVVATVWSILVMLVLFVVAFIFQCIFFIPAYLFLSKKDRRHLLGKTFRHVMGYFCVLQPLWRLKVVGDMPNKTPGRTIVMANHLSNADPFFLANALYPWEMKYISKSSLFKVPFGGWAMWLAGDIPVYFTSAKGGWGTKKGSVAKLMAHCKRLLAEETPIIAFPEGVRSKTGELNEFKDGMFSLAVETGADVIPVALSGSNFSWPKGDWKVDRATVCVTVGEPISSEGHDIQSLKEQVRAAIITLKEKLPDTINRPKSE